MGRLLDIAAATIRELAQDKASAPVDQRAHPAWRLIRPGMPDVEVQCCPDATRAEVLRGRADADAVPFTTNPKHPATPAQVIVLRRLYSALAIRNNWPMPQTWDGDQETVLSDPGEAMRALTNLCADQCPEVISTNQR